MKGAQTVILMELKATEGSRDHDTCPHPKILCCAQDDGRQGLND
jgi:hypothetical protein